MKWAKLQKDPDLQGITPAEREASFIVYPNLATIIPQTPPKTTAQIKPPSDFHVWATYSFTYNFSSPKSYEAFQKRYEIFCGGWLQYYDIEVQNGDTDHIIYFAWAPKKDAAGSYKVDIHISPPSKPNPFKIYIYIPSPGSSDPPKPPPPPPPTMG